MKPVHVISNVVTDKNELIMTIDGKEYVFAFSKISPRLLKASQIERERFEISPSGYGIYRPLLDEDISIDGLLGIKHETPSKLAA